MITIKIANEENILAERCGEDEVYAVYRQEYAPGDTIYVEFGEEGLYWVSLDASVFPALLWCKGTYRLPVPFEEKKEFSDPVKSLGVTGMRDVIESDISAMVRMVKSEKNIPAAVGFGISRPEQAYDMALKSDGVIVGSAIVRICEEYGRDSVPYVSEYVKEMKAAVIRADGESC